MGSRSPERRGSSYRSDRPQSRSPPRRRDRDEDRERDRHRDRSADLDRDRRQDRDRGRDRGRDRPADDDRRRYASRSPSPKRRRDASRSPSPNRSRDSPERSLSPSHSKRKHDDDSDDDSDRGGDDGSYSRKHGQKHKSSKSKKSKKKSKKKRETSAERRIRKAEERKQKESQIAAQMSATLGYTDKDNPFGDSSLSTKFIWVQKIKKEKVMGITSEDKRRADAERRHELELELAKLKKRREEREVEMQLREQEQIRMQREQDRIAFGDWEEREAGFHLQQAKKRAQIRIKEGRARPIDIMAMNLSLATDTEVAAEFDALGLEMDLEEPYHIFENIGESEVEELYKDIQLYLSLEKDENNRAFWEAMIIVCDDELSRHRAKGKPRTGVSLQVEQEISAMLKGKTFDQLRILQKQVENKLSSGEALDFEYWEALLKSVIVWKAKAKLRDMHQFMLHQRLTKLREQQRAEAEKAQHELREQVSRPMTSISAFGLARESQAVAGAEDEGDLEEEEEAELYDPSMSPRISTEIDKADADFDVVDEDADFESLSQNRSIPTSSARSITAAAAQSSMAVSAPAMDPEAAFIKESAARMGIDEEEFNIEDMGATGSQTYLWQDKYRPRKPRYFNRVHTGYEWNKYNQTHYDSDNPPPKVVQGYKFNIFYPDLIDKAKAPTFKIIRDEGYPDTVILRFMAGPPYEDVAFRIVNREWEHSHKKGFRSSFDRGVLQLHFHFKRQFYRR
ncbi:mid region of cactin-domain-containing protein [Polychytrium aggregatum]|uniref:mid region of cactin-domain-containing protein n=1 Tax=Polychytrium aggregatum TaxID=110093 RepID=UPI0022FEB184|nr:mid region of cactin-domain-containing protein [Polychytrium aggregatum]KAI9205362.1 mid region of cactin-domain-containing protein [Polychytrium aggregatum]